MDVALDMKMGASLMVSDAVKRSPLAHLFYFYPVLCEIASLPGKTPSAWIRQTTGRSLSNGGGQYQNGVAGGMVDGVVVEIDARGLAKKCLRLVGKEMGAAF